MGQVVQTISVSTDMNKVILNADLYTKGLYLVEFTAGSERNSQRLIIQ